MRRHLVVQVVPVMLLTVLAHAKTPPPFQWPPAATAERVAQAMAIPSESGLVILYRQATVTLNSFDTRSPGATREEVIRFLVVSEEGARNASVEVNDDASAKVTVLEGRTVALDGTVTPLDEKRDIKRVDVSSLRRSDPKASLASVAFPAPLKGAMLDLHFVTKTSEPVVAYSQPLTFSRTPALEADFTVSIAGGIPYVEWATMTVGDLRGVVQLGVGKRNDINVHVAPFTPPHEEPFAPPPHHFLPTFVAYMDFSSLRSTSAKTGVAYTSSEGVTPRGRLRSISFPSAQHREFWARFLTDDDKAAEKFIDKPGTAGTINVAVAAPQGMSLRERVSALYRITQERLVFNPDAENVDSVSTLMDKGFANTDQGTLLMAYLLRRAQIPFKLGLVANRHGIRFSPIFQNESLYGFEKVLVVELPNRPPMFMMPGYLDLPLGCLPEWSQESLVLFPKGDDDVSFAFTPLNTRGLDKVKLGYDLELDANGQVAGGVTLEQTGAPGLAFALWNREREFRRANPSRKDRNASQAELRAKQAEDEQALREELVFPGTFFQVENPTRPPAPPAGGKPVALTCKVTGKGLSQPAQGTWLVYAYPLAAGMTNRFVDETRVAPVWYSGAGRVVIEGDLRLPPGASVMELPQAVNLVGPDGTSASAFVEKVDRDGRVIIHSILEYDRPLAVGTDAYAAWRTFQASLQKLAQDRCLLAMPAHKELE